MKSLFKKFGYDQLLEESPAQGWVIPSIAEAMEFVDKGGVIEHDYIIVSDRYILDEPIEEDRCLLLNTKTFQSQLISRLFMMNCAVIVTPEICVDCALFGCCDNLDTIGHYGISDEAYQKIINNFSCEEFKYNVES